MAVSTQQSSGTQQSGYETYHDWLVQIGHPSVAENVGTPSNPLTKEEQRQVDEAIKQIKSELPPTTMIRNVDVSNIRKTGKIKLQYYEPNVYLDAYGNPVSVPPEKLELFKRQYQQQIQKIEGQKVGGLDTSFKYYKGEGMKTKQQVQIERAEELLARNLEPVQKVQEWAEKKTKFLEPKATDVAPVKFLKSSGRTARDIGVSTAFFPWTTGSIIGNIIITPKPEVKRRFKEGFQLMKQDIKGIPKSFKEKPVESSASAITTGALLFLPFGKMGKMKIGKFEVPKVGGKPRYTWTTVKGGIEEIPMGLETARITRNFELSTGNILTRSAEKVRIEPVTTRAKIEALTVEKTPRLILRPKTNVYKSFVENLGVNIHPKARVVPSQAVNVYSAVAVSGKGDVGSGLGIVRNIIYGRNVKAKSSAGLTAVEIISPIRRSIVFDTALAGNCCDHISLAPLLP